MDERFLSLAETRRRMDQVKLGGTRESITMLPIINCESTRCVIWVAKSTKAADDARRQLAAGTLLAPTVEAAEGLSRASQGSVRILSASTDSPVPPPGSPSGPLGTCGQTSEIHLTAEDHAETIEEPADHAGDGDDDDRDADSSAADDTIDDDNGDGAPPPPAMTAAAASAAVAGATPARCSRSSTGTRRRKSGEPQRRAAVMSVKHMPSLATVSQMHTDGTLHLFFASSNGWVTRSIFREAMHRWTAWEQIQDSDWEKRPKLLLMDGHAAHTDVASIKHLQDVGMRCAVPPGASSHMWQVFDNGPIGVFRKEFARIRLGAAAATLTGAVPCLATIIGLRQGATSPKVFAELEVDSGEGKTSGIFVRLKDARKTKVHPSDTLCAGYHAWVAAATPAVLAGGFVRTGTFAKGFTPDSKPTCDPEKILERMEAHRGGYDRDAIAAAVVERAMKSISDKSVLTPEFTSRMKKELDIIRVATNYGFADDVDGPNRAKRMALDLDNRQLVARTTDDFLRGNERYERHQRQLDVTDAHVNQIEAQARADHVLKSLRGLLEQAKRANAKARTTLKTISGTDVAQQASTSLAMIDSVLNTQATPTKAALKRDLLLDSPAASLVMDKLRLVKQLVFVGLQVASVSGALAPAPPSPVPRKLYSPQMSAA
ncbi:hypothetical protein FNF28_04136 [Cafeteria roenbergensis]|uniref:DDE-1 domain-containing protein n=1 Tax=Cafeteria roenbergensis TaxID=33653 RepID=A0A5A8DF92_CAFRO|nr:hypothetical protein FNF28_04136 [Cafeteria roenbergensis]